MSAQAIAQQEKLDMQEDYDGATEELAEVEEAQGMAQEPIGASA